jgi:hypothetical protein
MMSHRARQWVDNWSVGRLVTAVGGQTPSSAASPQAALKTPWGRAGSAGYQGYFDFPGHRDLRVPRSYVDDVPKIVTYWSSHDTGGHFPGVEEPKLPIDDMCAFFRPLRS